MKRSIWAGDLDQFADEDHFRWCFKGGSAPPPPPPPPPEKPKFGDEARSAVGEARQRRISLRKRTGRSALRTDLVTGSGINTPTRR